MAASQIIKVVFEGIDKTSKAAKSVQKGLGDTEKAIGNLQRSLGGMTAALAGAAGAAGFGLMARNALQTADALGKTSQKLGVTANELFKFQTQAELAGISTDTANMALQRFVRRTAEAAQGTGEAKNALIELGINAAEIQKLPLAERMKVLADAFADVQNPADRLRLAFKLFDSEGASMVNMLEGGREPLEETERRMRRLGLEIDDTAIPAMEEFNDTMELMKRQVQVAMIDGLGEATPVLQDLADKLAPVIVQITQGLLEGLQWLLNNLETVTTYIKNFAMVWAAFKGLQIAIALAEMAKALGLVRLAAIALNTAMGPIAIVLTAAAGAATYFADDLKALGKRFGILEDDTDDAAKETDNFTGSIEDLQEIVVTVEKKDLPAFAKEVDNLADEEIAATKKTDNFRIALEKLRKKALKPQRDLDEFTKKMKILQKQMEETEGPTEDLERQMAELVKEFTGVGDEAQEIRDEIAATKTAIDLLTKSGNASAGQISDLKDKLEDLGGKLVEVTTKNTGLTAAQNALLTEVNANKDAINNLNGKLVDLNALYTAGLIPAEAYRAKSAEIKGEIKKLRDEELTPLQSAISAAFDDTAIGEFLSTMEGLNSDPIFGELLGSFGSTKTAIDGCFSTTPVTDFGQAIKDLFTGGGSALGGFGAALGQLTSAFSGFFSGSLSSFSSFKDAIIQVLEEIAAAAIASVGINFLKNLIPGLRDGGSVDGFAYGGMVSGPGGPTADMVPAMLSNGEFVMQAKAVDKFGLDFMSQLNRGMIPGFASGGGVGRVTGGTIGSFSSFEAFMKWLRGLGYLVPRFFAYDPGGITLNPFGLIMQNLELLIIQAVKAATSMAANRMGGTPADYDGMYVPEIAGGIISKILGPIASAGNFDKAQELNNGFDYNGLVSSLFNSLLNPMQDFELRMGDFSFDQEVKKLFNDANAVAGGSLYVQGRQFGGPLERGQASVVGENGAELFVPNKRGRVSPISRDGGRELIAAVREVKAEVSALRRQMDRQNPVQLAGGRSA